MAGIRIAGSVVLLTVRSEREAKGDPSCAAFVVEEEGSEEEDAAAAGVVDDDEEEEEEEEEEEGRAAVAVGMATVAA